MNRRLNKVFPPILFSICDIGFPLTFFRLIYFIDNIPPFSRYFFILGRKDYTILTFL